MRHAAPPILRRATIAAALATAGLAAEALAEAPRVATDIPAVRSLAAQVMAGVGEPTPILPAGASPHGHAMRPSEARALQEADVVFWVGPSLTPWLTEAIETLAPDARSVALEEAPGVLRLPSRADAVFAAEDESVDRDAEHPHSAGHEHDAPGGHAAGDHSHAHPEGGDHGHDHDHAAGGLDPHLWLDPRNAAAWVGAMAEALADADPENAARYRANAAEAQRALDALTEEVEAMVAPVRGRPYLVFHDAYQYFENRFEAPAAGAVRLSDATDPGAARVAALRDLVREAGVVCVFAEPQFPPELLDAITEGAPARAGTLDPVGATLEPGATFYAELIRALGRDLAACLN